MAPLCEMVNPVLEGFEEELHIRAPVCDGTVIGKGYALRETSINEAYSRVECNRPELGRANPALWKANGVAPGRCSDAIAVVKDTVIEEVLVPGDNVRVRAVYLKLFTDMLR